MAIINKPSEHFETSLYTGTGSSLSISSLDFSPDLTWIKGRSGATEHVLTDSVRGVTKELSSNDVGAEETVAQGLTAFGSDGFTVGTDGSYNTSSATYASWNFKAGGTASSNTDGTITSSVSANTTSGMSIVSYTGNATAGATVGHGLGSVPKMIIVKDRDASKNWTCYHQAMGNDRSISLNLTNAQSVSTDHWNYTTPTSSVFSLGNYSHVNTTDDYIAYCFAEKQGYSKFGLYTGNGSTDGTFVYTGFKPAWIMVKRSSASGDNWLMFDNKRDTYNVTENFFEANSSDAEKTSASQKVDFLSNGFKMRATGAASNGSGSTYIYAAFASEPFTTSTTNGSIPATAR